MTHNPPVDDADCVGVKEALSRGEPLSAALQKHSANCPICGTERAREMEGTGALFATIQEAIQRERGPRAWLRSLPTRTRMAGVAMWAALLITAVAIVTPRAARGPVPLFRVVPVVAALAALATVALRIVLRPLQSPPPSRREIATCFVAGLLAPAVFALLPGPGPAVTSIAGFSSCTATTGCFVIGLVPGALVLVALRLLDRGGYGSRDGAFIAAITGGLVGNIALELHCPITTPQHLLLGHATVGVALVLGYHALTFGRARPT